VTGILITKTMPLTFFHSFVACVVSRSSLLFATKFLRDGKISPVVYTCGVSVLQDLRRTTEVFGQPKKIAIRNNLATRAPSPELRYFTATLGGSSGSPVLNDKWQVVGIHRGSIGTKVLSVQGRNSAIINLGTQMAAIRESVSDSLRTELGRR
jgi:hypothetical protein